MLMVPGPKPRIRLGDRAWAMLESIVESRANVMPLDQHTEMAVLLSGGLQSAVLCLTISTRC
jgi:hypothetical protein